VWGSAKFQQFLSTHNKKTFQEILRKESAGMPFLRACFRFNQKFGWLSESFDMRFATLEENSLRLFGLCKLFQEQREAVEKRILRLRKAEKRKRRYTGVIEKRLSRYVPGSGKLFSIFLNYVKNNIEETEEQYVFVQKLLARMRGRFLSLGEHLVDMGAIITPSDVFLLGWDEINLIIEKGSIPKKELVRRKDKLERDKHNYSSRKYIEQGNHLAPLLENEKSFLLYTGKGVSPGCSIAPLAIRMPEDALGDISGKILLAPVLNRRWDFDIVGVEGIITESGGISGHSAYIARQHGIPAVSGIAGLYKILQEGDIVYLNAFDGSVEVLHAASCRDSIAVINQKFT